MVTYAEAKKQLEIARQNEVPKAIEKIQALMAEYGLTFADRRGPRRGRRGRPPNAGKVTPTYKYMKDGMGYTGVGRRPAWVEALLKSGGDLEKYRIGAPAAAAAAPAAAKPAVAKGRPAKKAKKPLGAKRLAPAKAAAKPGANMKAKAGKAKK